MAAYRLREPGDPRFTHPALFYQDEAEYLAGVVPFILDGLNRDEPVTIAVPKENLDLVRAELSDELRDQAHQVRMFDMVEIGRNPARILVEVIYAAANKHPDRHIRVVGEPIWPGRSELEYAACLQHEALINLSFFDREASILCPYNARALRSRVLEDATLTHPTVLEHGAPRTSDRYRPEDALKLADIPLAEPNDPFVSFWFDAPLLRAARHLAGEQARLAGLSEARRDEFVLVIGELAANSIKHGGGSGTLRIWVRDSVLVGEVSDAGWLQDPLAGRRPASPTQLAGRGLLIVHHLADLVRTHSSPSGTRTRVYFAR